MRGTKRLGQNSTYGHDKSQLKLLGFNLELAINDRDPVRVSHLLTQLERFLSIELPSDESRRAAFYHMKINPKKIIPRINHLDLLTYVLIKDVEHNHQPSIFNMIVKLHPKIIKECKDNIAKHFGSSETTVMHFAALYGLTEPYQTLKSFGYSEEVKDSQGRTPIEYKEEKKGFDVSQKEKFVDYSMESSMEIESGESGPQQSSTSRHAASTTQPGMFKDRKKTDRVKFRWQLMENFSDNESNHIYSLPQPERHPEALIKTIKLINEGDRIGIIFEQNFIVHKNQIINDPAKQIIGLLVEANLISLNNNELGHGWTISDPGWGNKFSYFGSREEFQRLLPSILRVIENSGVKLDKNTRDDMIKFYSNNPMDLSPPTELTR